MNGPQDWDEPAFGFGPFHLLPKTRVLLRDGRPVQVGDRGLDLLTALLEAPGDVVDTETLKARAWPNTQVSEANLRVQVSALRKTLGAGTDSAGFIANVPGRGYAFIAPVAASQIPREAPAARHAAGNLPALPGRVFGQAAAIADVQARLQAGRLVTVVGPGGIGKTTVALASARDVNVDYAWFVDLSPLAEDDLVVSTVATVVGAPPSSGDAFARLAAHLAGKRALLILDNCEHVIESCAALASQLLADRFQIQILATSREPLRIPGEAVHRLSPLETPPEAVTTTQAALHYPAIQLFVERSAAHGEAFELRDDEVAHVVEICSRLDGIPLALELVAGVIGVLGLAETSARLKARAVLPAQGRRTALPRQQTLRAILDWSYDLLGPSEQRLLTDLAIFSGAFTLEAAEAVTTPGPEGGGDVFSGLAALAEKSLVVVDTAADPLSYRLLETTKAYGLERLGADASLAALNARRARYLRDVFAVARAAWVMADTEAWTQRLSPWINDLRASVEWAQNAGDDPETAAGLLADSVQLWIDLGLLPEFLERALAVLDRGRTSEAVRMQLLLVVGHGIYEIGAPPVRTARMHEAFAASLEIAKALGDKDHEFRTLISQTIEKVALGEYADIPPISDQFRALGHELRKRDVELYYNRSMFTAHMFQGNLAQAEHHVGLALADPEIRTRAKLDKSFTFDPLLFTLSAEARMRWIRGFPDQALALVADIIENAMNLGHLPSYINALQVAVMSVSIWAGDAEFNATWLDRYLRYGEEKNLDYRNLWRTVIGWGLDSREQAWDFATARAVIDNFDLELGNFTRETISTFHPGMTLPYLIDRVRAGKSGWCASEAFRGVAEGCMAQGDLAGAEAAIGQSLAEARRQGALSWELRSGMSLFDLRRRQQDPKRGHDELAAIYARFTEGFGSGDLRLAAARLGQDFE